MDEEQGWYFGIFAILLTVWPGIVYQRGGNAANVIYWLTALIVLAYTVETYGMRREMVRQNELAREQAEAAITPLLVARIEAQNVTNELMIRNIGHGPAFWVEVDEFTLSIARKGAARIAVTPDVVAPGKAEGRATSCRRKSRSSEELCPRGSVSRCNSVISQCYVGRAR
jgi:hypothetical protein